MPDRALMEERSTSVATITKYFWIVITAGMLVTGIAVGYASSNAYNSQISNANQQQIIQYLRQNPQDFNQMMSYWLQDQSNRQQLTSQLAQNPQFMQDWMADQDVRGIGCIHM